MKPKEAQARIKINKLLEDSGWRFFDDGKGTANIVLEPNVKLTKSRIDAFGENFEITKNGFIDFLLLDEKDRDLANMFETEKISFPFKQTAVFKEGRKKMFILYERID